MSNNKKLLLFFSTLLVIVIALTSLIILTPRPASTRVERGEPSQTISSPSPLVQGAAGELVLVTKVIDGDTIEIETGQHVRLIGVDTPETVDPKRPVGCFGKEASNEVKRLLEGKQVILEADVEDADKYKRLLRYVYLPLPDGQRLFVDDYLIREGFGKTLNIPPDNRYEIQFIEAQNMARSGKRGLWGKC